MDRNLGALRVAERDDDHRAYGWMYQWGRLTDGHEIRFSPTLADTVNVNDPGHDKFLTNSFSPSDWRDPQNDNFGKGRPASTTRVPLVSGCQRKRSGRLKGLHGAPMTPQVLSPLP